MAPARRHSASKQAAAVPAAAPAARGGGGFPFNSRGMPFLVDSEDDDDVVSEAERGTHADPEAEAKPKPCGTTAARPRSARSRPRSGKENCTVDGSAGSGGKARAAAAVGAGPPRAGAQAAAWRKRAAPKPFGSKKPLKQTHLSFGRKPAAAAPLAPVNQ